MITKRQVKIPRTPYYPLGSRGTFQVAPRYSRMTQEELQRELAEEEKRLPYIDGCINRVNAENRIAELNKLLAADT